MKRGYEMDDPIFYWITWMGWTITTFMMNKHTERFILSALLLCLIWTSTILIHIDGYTINGTLLLFALISYAYIGKQSTRDVGYSIFVSMLLSVVYLGQYFLAINDPVWIMFSFHWYMAIPLSLLSILLLSNLKGRLPVLLSGYVHGEIAYSIFLRQANPDFVTGSMSFLNAISIACFIVTAWSAYEHFTQLLKGKVDKPVKHVKHTVH
jgi:hypothetical protein